MRFVTAPNEVCEGNVFTGVCLSTGGGGVSVRETHHGKEWAVHILLECILVLNVMCVSSIFIKFRYFSIYILS